MKISMILAVDRNFAIGNNGEMLCPISADLRRFKKLTTDSVVVMGRKTFDSLPNRQPLIGRDNIVLTRDSGFQVDGATVVRDIELLKKQLFSQAKPVFIIGGGQIVSQLMPIIDYAYITKIDQAFTDYDTIIPDLDKLSDWQMVCRSTTQQENNIDFSYIEYQKIK